jgi:hypothetical protein
MRRILTSEAIAQAVADYQAGASVRELAKVLGVTPVGLYRAINRNYGGRLPPRASDRRGKRTDPSALADALGYLLALKAAAVATEPDGAPRLVAACEAVKEAMQAAESQEGSNA